MSEYLIEYADGSRSSETDLAAAENQLELRWPHYILGPWESAGPGRRRRLIWARIHHADNDDGQFAVAQLVRLTDAS
jgi:hypothetical protein